MRRREFITAIPALAWPLAARAQQAAKLPTIGFLGPATALAWRRWFATLTQQLRELGWIEGRTIVRLSGESFTRKHRRHRYLQPRFSISRDWFNSTTSSSPFN